MYPALSSPTFLAPMEGVTSPEVRQLIATIPGGAGCLCTEFVRISNNVPGIGALQREIMGTPIPEKHTLARFIDDSQSNGPIIHPLLSVQIMGENIQNMSQTAELLDRIDCQLVDLNFGCPAPQVYRKGCGSAMLKNPAMMQELVRAIVASSHKPVTAKMRAGIAEGDDFVTIALGLQNAGAQHIALHARTKTQGYSGQADHDKTKALVQALHIPVIANGDILFAQDALNILDRTGCAGVMIGRGGVANPFIFWQLDQYFRTGQKRPVPGTWVLGYLQDLIALWSLHQKNHSRLLSRLKEILRYSLHLLPSVQALQSLLKSESLDQTLELLHAYYAPVEITFERDTGSKHVRTK